MEGKKLLHSIRLKNLLSYGSEGVELDLEPLNLLIGPNGSGKSNLIEAIGLLAAAPSDLLKPLREGGGTGEWIWKGQGAPPAAGLEAQIQYKNRVIRYGLTFTVVNSRFELVDEFVRYERGKDKRDARRPQRSRDIYCYNGGKPRIRTRSARSNGGTPGAFVMTSLKDISFEQSILSQKRGSEVYPELTYLSNRFGAIAFFRNPNLGRFSAPRFPQRVDLPRTPTTWVLSSTICNSGRLYGSGSSKDCGTFTRTQKISLRR